MHLMRLAPQMRTLQKKCINSCLYSPLNEADHLLGTETEAYQSQQPQAALYSFSGGLFVGQVRNHKPHYLFFLTLHLLTHLRGPCTPCRGVLLPSSTLKGNLQSAVMQTQLNTCYSQDANLTKLNCVQSLERKGKLVASSRAQRKVSLPS